MYVLEYIVVVWMVHSYMMLLQETEEGDERKEEASRQNEPEHGATWRLY